MGWILDYSEVRSPTAGVLRFMKRTALFVADAPAALDGPGAVELLGPGVKRFALEVVSDLLLQAGQHLRHRRLGVHGFPPRAHPPEKIPGQAGSVRRQSAPPAIGQGSPAIRQSPRPGRDFCR